MLLVIIIAVPILLLLIWAVLFDFRHRHNTAPMTYRATRTSSGRTKNEAQHKGSEWGAGGI